MQKLLSLICFLLFTFNLFSQEVFDKYRCALSKKDFEIGIVAKNEKKFKIFIEGLSLDGKEGGVILEGYKALDTFRETLNQAKDEYAALRESAIENKVTKASKKMDTETVQSGYYKLSSSFYYDKGVRIAFYFVVRGKETNPSYLLIAKASRNKQISDKFDGSDGFNLVFSSTEDIDNFRDKISTDKIAEQLEADDASDLI